jgi:DNA-directed RNA polymerase subunit M/transcription elongation factor TFIIS
MNEYIRKKMVKNFLKYINLENSKKLEYSIFNFASNYANDNNTLYLLESIYETKSNEILKLLETNNLVLINLLKSNKIDYDALINMKLDELNPNMFEDIKNKKILENNIKNNKIGTKLYKCKKCKKKNSEIINIQTRSGDEPPTTIIKCLECGYTVNIN